MSNTILLTEQTLNDEHLQDACEDIQNDEVKILSIRDCKLTFAKLKNILKLVESSESLLQLCLCIGIITDQRRIDLLCRTIKANRSLHALFIHGNSIGDAGMKKLAKTLLHHSTIVSLDVGDCDLSDDSIETICNLLPPHGKKSGLIDLTMSSNPKITEQGWIKLSVSMAASSCLQELYLDYNMIGDLAASSMLVGLASHSQLQVLDLEGTCITERFAELLLYLIENYPTKLQKINLEENNIKYRLLKSIKSNLLDGETESEMSEKFDDASSVKSSPSHYYQTSDAELDETTDSTTETMVQTIEIKTNPVLTAKKTTPKKKGKRKPKHEETTKSSDSLWDGDELIEITEPPLISAIPTFKNFAGVNLGQKVSVSSGRGTLPEQDYSDEELKEVELDSLC
ncbi:leucine-rich repeat-containing protein 73-like [Mytilus galloprovincialis]|uniref:leucine-rich repeat-containing protein 73-like n=1 Tax=Mytilus galloprovincialis TaxID=29158 RepID=UPI003F7C2DFC